MSVITTASRSGLPSSSRMRKIFSIVGVCFPFVLMQRQFPHPLAYAHHSRQGIVLKTFLEFRMVVFEKSSSAHFLQIDFIDHVEKRLIHI